MNLQHAEIKQQIRTRFSKIAQSPENEQVFPVGPESARLVGYDTNEIDNLPVEVTESFSGVGKKASAAKNTTVKSNTTIIHAEHDDQTSS